jgi:hypothetical protein
MVCKLCHADRTLIDAHVIPRPFFTAQAAIGADAKLVSNVRGEFPKRTRTGVYDTVELLCYGLSKFTAVLNGNETIGFALPSFDYERLKLFFISLVWRAGESSHAFFRRVSLGQYADRARANLLARDPGAPDDFATVLSAFTVGGRLPTGGLPIADPFREKWDGVTAYRFSLGVITAYVKVDQVPFGPVLRKHCLRPADSLRVISRDFANSSEMRVLRRIAGAPLNRRVFGQDRGGR